MAAFGAGTARGDLIYRPETVELPSFDEISTYHLTDETRLAGSLVERAVFTGDERHRTRDIAATLVRQARAERGKFAGVDAFMAEYGFSSDEGAILMCIAESLLRIPDSATADQLIADKISEGAWEKHLGHSDNLFVNASTWGLMLTGRVVKLKDATGYDPVSVVKRLVARSGEPVIRQAVRKAVHILGDQFVMAPTVSAALERARPLEADGYLFSYDLLGEAAKSDADARTYFEKFQNAIESIGRSAGPVATEHPDELMRRPGLSIKLSCLHPRFEPGKEERLRFELLPRVRELLRLARDQGVAVCFDAEEQARLEPTLGIFADAYFDPALDGWHGLGIAVQAYSKRAIPVLRWLRKLSQMRERRIPVRLVKGAYWDSEIKLAQQSALADYPVFSRKLYTDVSYLACMRLLMSDTRAFYPQIATHNAFSLAAGIVAGRNKLFEFQRLHGMGEALHSQIVKESGFDCPCRIYAPVGGHENLLSFLVRRILENGANTSFINRLADNEAPVSEIISDPVAWAERELNDTASPEENGGMAYALAGTRQPLVKPCAIFQPERDAAAGMAFDNFSTREKLISDIATAMTDPFDAGPLVCGEATIGTEAGARLAFCPHDVRERFGTVCDAGAQHIETALSRSQAAATSWERTPAPRRAELLERAAGLFERDSARFMAALVREGGKTLRAAHDEVRHAVDYLRYYASEARHLFGEPLHLKSPTGETNRHGLRGRGPFICLSPWNSPLAIFTGQVGAALAAGNPVIAKPSEMTPMNALLATQRLIEAGVPSDVLHLLTGGDGIGAQLVKDTRIAGVALTGSTQTAWAVQKQLAERRATLVPLIAATSGLNVMVADSSALPEQVVQDAIRSSFAASGTSCAGPRVLFIQDEIADKTIDMLVGAIGELDIGDPIRIATDVGPTINEAWQDQVDSHKLQMHRTGRELVDCPLPEQCRVGSYVTPAAFEVDAIDQIGEPVLGPIFHIIRYERGYLSRVIDAINTTGYGLTLGLHSRIGAVADFVGERARVGNIYINRDQVSASVGAQPFGGEALSGTGVHAGGPNYLARFAVERVRTCNITATGGNLDLLRRTTQRDHT